MRHPRERRSPERGPQRRGIDRRDFLRGVLGAGLAVGAAPLLDACNGAATGATGAGLQLPRPNRPVTWPLYPSNRAIPSGRPPETGATLKLYNWVAYINQAVLNAFEKKYNCKIELTTFNTMSEAIAKLQTGGLDFDVFFPTVDVLGPLVQSKLIRPLNHSYIPNIRQAWPKFQNPFYDGSWRYTVPYTIYTTGIAWRKDKVPENPYAMANAWAMPWQGKYRGKVAILDDYRESISLGLMKNGIFDLNTTSSSQIDLSKSSLLALEKLTNAHIDNNDYSNVPDGEIWIHHAWSGDMAAAAAYMPKGVPVEVVGYWFPTNGKGPVGNDTMVVLASGQNPVLAHLFLDYLLDLDVALENISYNGYMQPITGVTPHRLIAEKILPPSLTSTVVLPSYFDRGLFEGELSSSVDAAWQQAWLAVSSGV